MMMLDTDTCIFAIRGHQTVCAALRNQRPDTVSVSVIVAAELYKGPYLGTSDVRLGRLKKVQTFLNPFSVVPFRDKDAIVFGQISAHLTKQGAGIGELDALIASHALSLGFVLVTNNLRHHSRIPGLVLKNWMPGE
jgi:tRNA(fMet)-specific endonuclease VapC